MPLVVPVNHVRIKHARSHARSKIIVPENALLKSLVRDGPRPSATGFAAEQALRTRGFFQHAVFLHGLHFVAGGVGQEVLKVLVFEGEGVAGDAYTYVNF